ncbi:MAG: class I SAM-dependent methyltransferase [bacterium]|nr:class I SAM-dependent methyltransferase [bacterium]
MHHDDSSEERLHRLAQADPLAAWPEDGALPWGDSAFSERVLQAHLDPDTPVATRPLNVVARHLDWLEFRLASTPARILDICCGPGLYCHELARRGHRAVGTDIAPAALAWAARTARTENLACTFHAADLMAPMPTGLAAAGPFDAVTCWFGDFHAFPAPVASRLLGELATLLVPGGCVVLEIQPWDEWEQQDQTVAERVDGSFFLDAPHLWLQRHRWDEAADTEVHGHWLLDEADRITRYVQCHQAWRPERLGELLMECGLERPEWHDPIADVEEGFEFPVLVAWRR